MSELRKTAVEDTSRKRAGRKTLDSKSAIQIAGRGTVEDLQSVIFQSISFPEGQLLLQKFSH